MMTKRNSAIQKNFAKLYGSGYKEVEKKAKKFGTYKCCENCDFRKFGECSNKEVTEFDISFEYGRMCCSFWEQT